MKFKITSDGTSTGTRLINSSTGEVVSGVTKLIWQADADGNISCTVTLIGVEIDAFGELSYMASTPEFVGKMPQRIDLQVTKKTIEDCSAQANAKSIAEAEDERILQEMLNRSKA